MKSSKFWLIILLLSALILCNCPKVSTAAEPEEFVDFSVSAPSFAVSYVCVQLKDFPLGVLWRLKDMASSIKQEIPKGLSVGREKIKDQGFLLFSYQKKEDGVLLSMSFQRLSEDPSYLTAVAETVSSLSEQRIVSDPSGDMITETLRDLFSTFCLAWEENSILPMQEDKIVLWNKKLDRTSS